MEALMNELQVMKSDEIERNLFDDVMTIKQNVLEKSKDQSERLVLNSLLKLYCMPLSVKLVESTKIGKSVSALRKHDSEIVRDVARMIIKNWRLMVDSWVKATYENEENGSLDDSNMNLFVPEIRLKLKNDVRETKESAPKQNFSSITNGVDQEVLRIKEILEKSGIENELVMCDSLRELERMKLSVKNLFKTGIGKTVSVLRKHESKDVGEIASMLISKWKRMVKLEFVKIEYSNVNVSNRNLKQQSESCMKVIRKHKTRRRSRGYKSLSFIESLARAFSAQQLVDDTGSPSKNMDY